MKKYRFRYWLVWMIPRKVVYYCGVRLWCHATTGKYSDTVADEVTMNEILTRWEDKDE